MSNVGGSKRRGIVPGRTGAKVDQILRFRRSERLIHWGVAVPFMACFLTAVILVTVYNPHPARPYRQLVSWIHRLSGLCLLIVPPSVLLRHRRDLSLHVDNVRRVWRWTLGDVKWLMLIGAASFSRRVRLPHQGKFNAGEKINFVVLTASYPLYIITGLLIWFGGVPYISWLAHFSLALGAAPLLLGHIFMALVNPDTRPGLSGMVSGFVSREWASHHYHLWYREQVGHGDADAGATPPAVQPELEPDRQPTVSWVRARGSLLGAALLAAPETLAVALAPLVAADPRARARSDAGRQALRVAGEAGAAQGS